MKKEVLKTILKDFFKLKYPLAMIIIVVVLGAGIVWAFNSRNTGYRLNKGITVFPINTPNGAALVSNDSVGSDYFVPTKNSTGWISFVQHCPSSVTIQPALCVAGTYYDSSQRCTDTCLTCPANYYCNSGNKYACPSGTTSPAGSTSFSACVPAGNTCTPQRSCASFAGQDCGVDSCSTACGPVCPVNEFCDNKHFCEPNL